MKMNTKKLALALIAILMLIGYLMIGFSGDQGTADQAAARTYPGYWGDLDLPQIPGGKLGTAVHDEVNGGMKVELFVDQSVEDVRKYYEEFFEDEGYTNYDESQDSNGGGYVNDFANDEVDVNVDISVDPQNENGSRIRISISQETEQESAPSSFASFRID